MERQHHLLLFAPPPCVLQSLTHNLEFSQQLCYFAEVAPQAVESPSPFSTAFVKSNICVFFPLITQIRNHSFQAVHLTSILKTGLFSKKPYSGSLPIYHFCQRCWTKLLLLSFRIHTNSTTSMRSSSLVSVPAIALRMPQGPKWPDDVHHDMLLTRLHSTIGLSDSVLSWFQSYLSGRMKYVSLGEAKTWIVPVTYGVTQGSVLDHIPFILYMLPHSSVISWHGLSFHCYADDTQLHLRPNPPNYLQLNGSKTEAISVDTPHQAQSSPVTQFTIPLSISTINLEVRFDPHPTFLTSSRPPSITCTILDSISRTSSQM